MKNVIQIINNTTTSCCWRQTIVFHNVTSSILRHINSLREYIIFACAVSESCCALPNLRLSPVGPIFQSTRLIVCSWPPQSSPSPFILQLIYSRHTIPERTFPYGAYNVVIYRVTFAGLVRLRNEVMHNDNELRWLRTTTYIFCWWWSCNTK